MWEKEIAGGRARSGGGEDEEGVDEVVMRVREMKRGKARIAGFISISFSA